MRIVNLIHIGHQVLSLDETTAHQSKIGSIALRLTNRV